MSSLNKVFLIGFLGLDPEIRYTKNNDAVASISIATSERWRKADGEYEEKTEWHRVSAFRRTAELIRDYTSKGSKIHIEGKITYDKYKDKQGVEKTATKIIANHVIFLDKKEQKTDHEDEKDDDNLGELPF